VEECESDLTPQADQRRRPAASLLVGKAEELVLAALPVRLSELYLTAKLGVGQRTLRRSFLDARGVTAYVGRRALVNETTCRFTPGWFFLRSPR
jgi:hypothetical protein